MNNNIGNSINKINKLYENISYYDEYGTSVIIFLLITLFVFLVYSYCIIMQTRSVVKDDWLNQRCKPQVIPFAGLINKPDNMTAFEYTGENFQYCVQDILKNIIGYAIQPFNYTANALSNTFMELGDSLNKIRNFLSYLREKLSKIIQDVLNRVLNVIIPIQQIFIALIDSFSKAQGVMTAGLYTMLGTYYTLKAFLGSVLQLIITFLIILVVIIVALWIVPFTWPVAASMSAVFLSISIPLAIVVYFMTEVMNIQTSSIPKLRCFDKNTILKMNDGTFKRIELIENGDILQNNNKINSKIKILSKGLRMFSLNGIIISESHIVKYKDKWIYVIDHPEAMELDIYNEPYLYCLNTSTKEIEINDTIFTDWDEIYDTNLTKLLNKKIFDKNNNIIRIERRENINKYLDIGYDEDALIKTQSGYQLIRDIKLESVLENNSNIVYGIVEIYNNLGKLDIMKKQFNLLTTNKSFNINGKMVNDYNYNVDFIIDFIKNKI